MMENLECLYERCEDCPHWTGTECDGNLVTEEWARKWMADQGENEYGIDAIIGSIDRLEDLTPAKFMEICRDHWDR